MNGEGKEFCKFINERGWGIVNGCYSGDEEGEWTFVGEKGCSVIDLVLIQEKIKGSLVKVEVVGRNDSDCLPTVVEVGGKGGGWRNRGGKGR